MTKNLILLSANNDILYKNYKKTVENPIKTSTFNHLGLNFNSSIVSIWGLNPTPENKNMWNKTKKGDIVLFFKNNKYFSKAQVTQKIENKRIPLLLWENKLYGQSWFYLLILKNIVQLSINFNDSMPFFIEPTMPGLFSFPIIIVNEQKVNNLISIFGSLDIALNSLSNSQFYSDNKGNDQLVLELKSEKVPLDVKLKLINKFIKNREGQNLFRKNVLLNYGKKCVICGINNDDILEASHIIPVADVEISGLMENGICFCILHHKLFDNGYFSISDDYKIILSDKIKLNSILKSLTPKESFISGCKIFPSKKFLRFHRIKFGFDNHS